MVFIGLCVSETLMILYVNSGHFLYTLDDPYIHLGLAENIAKGHYGINLSEYSAPSSSILWPFLLAPFTPLPIAPYIPLILNMIASVGTLIVLGHLSARIIKNQWGATSTVIVLMLSTNLVALSFTGMEHCLQIFVTVLIAAGLIVENLEGFPPWWLLVAIVLEPLIRYEGVIVTLTTIGVLVIRRHYKAAFWCSVISFSLLGGFSWFLMSLGLERLPNSVIVKAFTHTNGGDWGISVFRAALNLQSRAGAILVCGLLFLAGVFIHQGRPFFDKLLAVWAAVITISHLVTAPLRDTSLFIQVSRYDAYVMALLLVVLLYVYRDFFFHFFAEHRHYWIGMQAAVLLVFIAHQYLIANLLTPIASNNIYEQQYQMRRFLHDFHHEPIAVNDLGLTSYGNSNYVLDLWGLGNLEAFYARANREQEHWMNDLASAHNVRTAIIYDSWFPSVPPNWTRVATLHLSKLRLTPAEPYVSFYALNQEALPRMYAALEAFQEGLPPRVELKFEQSLQTAKAEAQSHASFAKLGLDKQASVNIQAQTVPSTEQPRLGPTDVLKTGFHEKS